jgi:uncharacterized membrane protein
LTHAHYNLYYSCNIIISTVILTISKIMNKALLITSVSTLLGSLLFATITPIQQAKAQAGAMIEAGRAKRATELLQRGGSAEDAGAIMRGENPGSQKVAPNTTAAQKATPKSRVRQKKRK